MKMFKRSLALMFAVLLCCMTVFAVSATGEDNDVVDDWDGAPEEEEPTYNGDLTKDGNVNGADYNILLRYVLGTLPEAQIGRFDFTVADITGDGTINGADYNILLRYVLGTLPTAQIERFNLPPIDAE